jgi:hypothetical protein
MRARAVAFGGGGERQANELEHDPEKWEPVFGKDHAQTKKLEHDPEKWEPVFEKRSCSNKEARA